MYKATSSFYIGIFSHTHTPPILYLYSLLVSWHYCKHLPQVTTCVCVYLDLRTVKNFIGKFKAKFNWCSKLLRTLTYGPNIQFSRFYYPINPTVKCFTSPLHLSHLPLISLNLVWSLAAPSHHPSLSLNVVKF